jgi:hypothetical protein
LTGSVTLTVPGSLQGEKALRTWLNTPDPDRGTYPEPFLAPLPELVRRATSDGLVSLSDGQRKAIDQLHAELRNEFMHMSYGGWSIEIAGLPAILLEVLSVVSSSWRANGFSATSATASVRNLSRPSNRSTGLHWRCALSFPDIK